MTHNINTKNKSKKRLQGFNHRAYSADHFGRNDCRQPLGSGTAQAEINRQSPVVDCAAAVQDALKKAEDQE